jgi:AraC family transcriptional regulator of adaptative response/methylated-DNA-[protein]-cysteine methyltransferase
LSKYHFDRLFKRWAGISPVQFFETWPGASFTENSMPVSSVVKKIFDQDQAKPDRPFNLHLKGTNFQINVWKALLRIPEGWVACYQDIAAYIGRPKALRAVAGAIAVNPVAYLIPCHRVIAKSGKIHQYRWGAARKKAMFAWEAARSA